MERVVRIVVVWMLCLALPAVAAGKSKDKQEEDGPRLGESTFKGLELRGIGPALMSGRIADIAIHPKDADTWYVAVGSGGVFKTENAGTTWKPIFDDQGSYSIGCVTIDAKQPEIVWVGSGENVGGRHVGYGDGVYKSLDGGESWENVGLKESEHISRILVDPRNSNTVYVAVQGPLWSGGGDRGLYKTPDGGTTWEKILGGGEYTGVNDVAMDPRDPNVLYATTHQRLRNVAALVNGGPETAIHKSIDGGKTWRELENGLPKEDMGKIGLAISPQDPDVIYAAIELAQRKGGVWRSDNTGGSWTKMSDHVAGGTGPHYYQEIYASPHKFDRLYFMEVRLHTSEDGGKSWTNIEGKFKHVDNHAIAFNPNDPDYLLAGCDGGLYESWDLGETWKFVSNLPITQFYKVAVDYDEPFYNVYGGTQDNNTQGGPSRTDNNTGIRNSDWFITLFGDGHQPAVDPTNPDIIYSEWQEGNLVRHDRKTGEIVYIQPQPAADEPMDRFNWDAPILISPHDPKTLFYASQRVWRSGDRGDSWVPISGDLTRNIDRLKEPMMGRVQSFDTVWDVYAMSKYSTITSLAQSPLDAELIYAGTDDGLLQVTEDGGKSWRMLDSLPGVDDFWFVNDVKADLHNVDTAYVVVDNHKAGNFEAYVLKSTDRGKSWKSIAGDLPKRHVAWRLVQDHEKAELLFLGTEFGVFFTIDGGERWVKLGGGAPNIPFRDLVIQTRENDLVAATFGRSFWILDDYTPLRHVSDEMLEQESELFPVKKTWWYLERRPLGGRNKASQGDAFFTAPNPPFGAVFTYYLRDEIKTRKERRREAEKKIATDKGDTPYPGWEELRREREEEEPAILLTVRNAAGEIVRRLTGPVKSGFHRVAWDLRYPSKAPWRPSDDDEEWRRMFEGGALAPPGRYSVSMAKRIAGEVTPLGRPQDFEVVPLRKGTLPGATPKEVSEFTAKLEQMRGAVRAARATIDEASKSVNAIVDVLDRSRTEHTRLDARARKIRQQLADLVIRLNGDNVREVYGDPGPISISGRLDVANTGTRFSTYGPTPTHRRNVEIAREQFTELQRELDQLLKVDLATLEKELDAAGVPWTPGRTAPAME